MMGSRDKVFVIVRGWLRSSVAATRDRDHGRERAVLAAGVDEHILWIQTPEVTPGRSRLAARRWHGCAVRQQEREQGAVPAARRGTAAASQ